MESKNIMVQTLENDIKGSVSCVIFILYGDVYLNKKKWMTIAIGRYRKWGRWPEISSVLILL